MKIEPSIIDGNIEKKGLYTNTSINTLKDKENEEADLESAEKFRGVLDEYEELYSAREIGKAYVPNVPTLEKKKAREVDEVTEKAFDAARNVDDEFGEMAAKLDDIFR